MRWRTIAAYERPDQVELYLAGRQQPRRFEEDPETLSIRDLPDKQASRGATTGVPRPSGIRMERRDVDPERLDYDPAGIDPNRLELARDEARRRKDEIGQLELVLNAANCVGKDELPVRILQPAQLSQLTLLVAGVAVYEVEHPNAAGFAHSLESRRR
jgi:hypothetical protein